MGIDTTTLTDRALTATDNVINEPGFLAEVPVDGQAGVFVHPIDEGGNTATIQSLSPVSIFQSSECRIKVSVESFLPVQSSIEIRDEKETNNREIVSAFFLNDVKVNCVWNASGSLENYGIESKVFAGQFPLIHQNSRVSQWNRLLTSYNLQILKFFLNVHYRYFDDAASVWKILIKRVDISENDYWAMKIRFVSDE